MLGAVSISRRSGIEMFRSPRGRPAEIEIFRSWTGPHADGTGHPGLPWAGCAVLAAPAGRVAEVRAKAAESLGVFVADMPVQAQATRVYDEYRRQVAGTRTAELAYHAVSLVGPRNRVDKLVHRLGLLT